MRYVILRDDDTNALTPVDCLERLYRPFLERGLPVNLAVIPDVAMDATTPHGEREGFLHVKWSHENLGQVALSPREERTGREPERGASPPLPSPLLRLHSEERERAPAGETPPGSPSPPQSEGLEPFGKRRKECAEHRPQRAERAGASESLGRVEVALRIQGKTSTIHHSLDIQRGSERKTTALGVECSVLNVSERGTLPISSNAELAGYLRENTGYHIVQHGCHHDCFEFDRESPEEIAARLDRGTRLLAEAGFPKPETFVAPHDKFSRAAYREVRKRFRVISSGWFERGRLPVTWWPCYAVKKIHRAPHWRVGDTALLSHPGCLLSWRRPYDSMLAEIAREIRRRRLTVLVTHWWEYFRDGRPDEEFISRLHETAEYLATECEIRVVNFADVASGRVPLD